eukprot:709610-Pelagomonas_calceolata.AAC.3
MARNPAITLPWNAPPEPQAQHGILACSGNLKPSQAFVIRLRSQSQPRSLQALASAALCCASNAASAHTHTHKHTQQPTVGPNHVLQQVPGGIVLVLLLYQVPSLGESRRCIASTLPRGLAKHTRVCGHAAHRASSVGAGGVGQGGRGGGGGGLHGRSGGSTGMACFEQGLGGGVAQIPVCMRW